MEKKILTIVEKKKNGAVAKNLESIQYNSSHTFEIFLDNHKDNCSEIIAIKSENIEDMKNEIKKKKNCYFWNSQKDNTVSIIGYNFESLKKRLSEDLFQSIFTV